MKNYLLLLLLIILSCNLKELELPGALVPPTADQDKNLPQITIHVAGHDRAIHLQTFGNPNNPPVFVLHGGPGGDFKLLLPLKAIAGNFYVAMWDSRGAGLSERVTKEELSIESFDEEIAQVKAAIAPDKKIILIGHSFGAAVEVRYTARHPEQVQQLIMIEPGKLNYAADAKSNGGAVNFLDGQNFFWQNEILTSGDHAAADYKAVDLLPYSARNWTCDGSIVTNYPFWRFGAYHYYIVQKNMWYQPKDYNWAADIENFKGKISVVCGSCGALGETFQRKANLPLFPGTDLHVIPNAGHLSLFTDYAILTVDTIKSLLK
jgi:proline iminopeptidase